MFAWHKTPRPSDFASDVAHSPSLLSLAFSLVACSVGDLASLRALGRIVGHTVLVCDSYPGEVHALRFWVI